MIDLMQLQAKKMQEQPKPTKIPNVYKGTELGKVISPGGDLVGCRVIYQGCFGTVHFVGRLPIYKSSLIGVDWDDPTRGRHDGAYAKVSYFQASARTSGSFVKPEQLSMGASLEEAILYRYVICTECQLTGNNPATDDGNSGGGYVFQSTGRPGRIDGVLEGDNPSGDAEFTGVDTSRPIYIEMFNSVDIANSDINLHANCGPQGAENALRKLRSICLSQIPVYRCLHSTRIPPEAIPVWPKPGGHLGSLLPRLVELDLSHCLFSKWIDIAEICAQLPTLEILNVSNNRLRFPLSSPVDPTSTEDQLRRLQILSDLNTDAHDAETLFKKAFPKLLKLVAVKMHLLDWPGLCDVITWMPCLQSLAVAHNYLGNPNPNQWPDDSIDRLRSLVDLDMTSTGVTDLTGLFTVFGPSTVLNTLLLNQNAISDWPEKETVYGVMDQSMKPSASADSHPQYSTWLSGLSVLALQGTKLSDWCTVRRLLHMPKLDNLTLSDCPMLDQLTFENVRQELIARLPRLTVLNRIHVDKDERRGAELDYLKRYGAVWLAAVSAVEQNSENTVLTEFHQEHPTFSRLCDKFDPPEIGETKKVTRALKEGLVKVTFLCQSLSDIPNHVSLPEAGISRDIPIRMSVGHLRMMVRRMFKLPAKTTFEMVVQSERHRKIGADVPLDNDTRELAYYSVENGDTVYVRLT